MNMILLSGGSGRRLWPLSNDVRSKQFLPVFQREDGAYESMVQRVYRQIKTVDKDATVTIATRGVFEENEVLQTRFFQMLGK